MLIQLDVVAKKQLRYLPERHLSIAATLQMLGEVTVLFPLQA